MLKKRQDMFSTMAASLWKGWNQRDIVWIEIPIERVKPLKLEFLITNKP
jgi:hypothetical protein